MNTTINGIAHRAGPKAAGTGPKRAPKEPFKMVPERLVFRVSSGAVSPALGPALWGCSVDRCVHLRVHSFVMIVATSIKVSHAIQQTPSVHASR